MSEQVRNILTQCTCILCRMEGLHRGLNGDLYCAYCYGNLHDIYPYRHIRNPPKDVRGEE